MKTYKNLEERFDAPGPKRILALDGGGIRGALTLGYLQKIERILRNQHNDPNMVLSDYFDLIGGTSTGALIATLLSMEKTIEEIRTKYDALGIKIFGRKVNWWNVFTNKFLKADFDEKPIEEALLREVSDITLGNQTEIKTGLCIVAKRADTNSIWPFINHPRAKYYDRGKTKNKDFYLRDLLRATSAAPTYFLPHVFKIGSSSDNNEKGAFIDGGVSMANNPALHLLMIATLKGFPFHWKLGEENLLLVSVGTGMGRWSKLPDKLEKSNLISWAGNIPDMFMQDASWHNQTILQWLSNTVTPWDIDSEIGSLDNDSLSGVSLLNYLRYNLWLDHDTLKVLTGKEYNTKKLKDLVEMSNAENSKELYEIGVKASNLRVNIKDRITCTAVEKEHFGDKFKIN